MDYKEMRKEVENMINNNYNDFVKAVVSVELGINDEKGLDLIYDKYMEDDSAGLLNENFDYIVDELKEQGKIIDNQTDLNENKNLVNIIGNISGEVEKPKKESVLGKIADYKKEEKEQSKPKAEKGIDR